MRLGKRFVGCLFIILVGVASAIHADEAAARQDLAATIERYDLLFSQKFGVNVKSAEINSVLKQQIAQMTQKMFGIPLQVDIAYFTFLYNKGASQVRASLANVPEQQKKQMEQQANQMLKNSPIGAALQAVAYDALRQGIVYLKENNQQCVLKKETTEVADFMLDMGGKELIQGLKVKNAWFRVDRQQKTIGGIQFSFVDDTSILIRLTQQEMAIAGGGQKVPVLSKTSIKQTALKTGVGGGTLPAQIEVVYGGYKFFPAQ